MKRHWLTAPLRSPGTLGALALIWCLFVASWWMKPTAGWSTWGVSFGRGWLGIAWSNGPMGVTAAPSDAWPIWQVGSGARLVLAPQAAWRPSTSQASMTVSAGAGTPAITTVDSLWIPLWWVGIVLTGIAVWPSIRNARRKNPGHCAACGYDLRGTPHSPCPECGEAA